MQRGWARSAACLRVHGPDQQGIVRACSQLLDKFGCTIMESEQYTDPRLCHFYQRSLFHPSNYSYTDDRVMFQSELKSEIIDELRTLQTQFGLDMVKVNFRDKPKKMAIFVSKYDHCLWEILLRYEARELDCDISVVISNHPDVAEIAESFKIPFRFIPINPKNKKEQEKIELDILKNEFQVDVIVLARYMQVLSNDFLNAYDRDQIINIHHSFLPAFMGAKPYHRAYQRGIKLIGATGHYVTEHLDEGPIIDQDVIRVSHRDEVSDLIRKGRIIERNVLLNAIEAHLADRIITHNNKCVVFSD